MKAAWERNIWTGNDILRVSDSRRIIRCGSASPLYRMEEWGNHSLDFPRLGPWRKSLADAKRDRP